MSHRFLVSETQRRHGFRGNPAGTNGAERWQKMIRGVWRAGQLGRGYLTGSKDCRRVKRGNRSRQRCMDAWLSRIGRVLAYSILRYMRSAFVGAASERNQKVRTYTHPDTDMT
jgi:hypothetical protein